MSNSLSLPDDNLLAANAAHIATIHQGFQWLQQVVTGEVAADSAEVNHAIAVMQQSAASIETFHAQLAPMLLGAAQMIETAITQRDEAIERAEELENNIAVEIEERLGEAMEEISSESYYEGMSAGIEAAFEEADVEQLSDMVSEGLTVNATWLAGQLRRRGEVDAADKLEALTTSTAENLQTVTELHERYALLLSAHLIKDAQTQLELDAADADEEDAETDDELPYTVTAQDLHEGD